MISSYIGHTSENGDNSSDDENLLELKRKGDISAKSDKRIKYDRESDDEGLLAQVLVSVEVEEVEECPLDYTNKNKTTSELQLKKSSKPKKLRAFPCPDCDNVFYGSPGLKKHALEHQVQTRHKCEECGRYFKKAFSLRMHRRVHMEKIEKCPLCHLTFNSKNILGRHMMSHERTKECAKCHAKFHTTEQLDDHEKSHVEGKNDKGMYKESTLKPENTEKRSETSAVTSTVSTQSDPDKSDKIKTANIKLEIDATSDESTELNQNIDFSQNDSCLKRDDLTHSTQCAIVSKMHKGRSVADVCRLYNLTPEIVNEIWEDREKYMIPKKGGKMSVKYMNSVLDNRIVEWFQNQRANDVHVSGKILQDTAEAFAKESGFVAFNGSKKWLDRFKKKYNISFRSTPSKRDYKGTMDSKWRNYFFKEQWSDARLGVADEDIYTGDEVGLYYNPSKGRIKKQTGKKFIQGYVKDRLAIFLCTNVNGTDKKKLLVCGSEDPLVHSHRNPDTLPVTYIRHSQAHFTTPMFEEYVITWNRELQMTKRKAILILDRATIHSKLQLSNLKLIFIPWKASSGLVPIKNGIYNRFRDEFRRLLLEEKAMNVLRSVDRNLTCLEALNMLEKAWDRTPTEIIIKSFLTAGYDIQSEPVAKIDDKPKVGDDDEEVICKLLQDYDVESYYTDLGSLDMFLTVDEELLTGQGTNGSVFGGNHKVIDTLSCSQKEIEEILPISTEKPDADDKEAFIMKSRAMQDLDVVKKFLQTNDTPYEMYRALMEVEMFVTESPNKC